jgi:hypothetical protein
MPLNWWFCATSGRKNRFPLARNTRLPTPAQKPGFAGVGRDFHHHINGVFAADMMGSARIPQLWRRFCDDTPRKASSPALRVCPKSAPIRCLPGMFA